MKSRFAVLRGFLTRARGLFPPTVLGLAVGGGSALAMFHYGLERIDLLLLVVGIVGLGLVALSMLLTGITALVLWLKLRKLEHEGSLRAECAYPRRTKFVLKVPWFVPFVRVGWGWLEPDVDIQHRRRGLRIEEEIVPFRRALREDLVRVFEVSDSFGFSRVTFPVREARKLRFSPSVGALKQMHVVRSMAAGDEISHPEGPPHGEMVDMRAYAAGDPIRFVLWKVFARSRELVVRAPERAIGPVHQTVAYLVTHDDDEPAAGAARVAVETGALGGDWILGADGCAERVTTVDAALELLARSANHPEAGGTGLSDFLKEATPGGVARALVFVPATPGPWMAKVSAAARKTKARLEIIVCTDGVDRENKKRGLWSRAAVRDRSERDPKQGIGLTPAADVNEVVKALAAAGRIVVLDRIRGRVYTEAHRRAMEAA